MKKSSPRQLLLFPPPKKTKAQRDTPTRAAVDGNRRRWIRAHHDDRAVQEWLAANPPPRDWINSKMAWAYERFPSSTASPTRSVVDAPMAASDVPTGARRGASSFPR